MRTYIHAYTYLCTEVRTYVRIYTYIHPRHDAAAADTYTDSGLAPAVFARERETLEVFF